MKEGEEEEGEAHGNANVELTCIFGYSTLYQKKVSMYFCLLIRVKLPFGFRDLKYLSRIEDYAMKCLLILCK